MQQAAHPTKNWWVKNPPYRARTPEEKKVYERQIGVVDGQIDRAVYELYGLGEEEIKIVEGG